ncbi:hypothetical protein AYI69_g10317 [Smittium culicis]|uniref:FCP1 homology domain-containing protein n=1 Tax=Smittium culicis TaxID=133412 RepID=A0A1R1X6N8_9FUNG|nr:hypothetical protein AYI69_g10317 [Smittium culicis]
MNSQRKIFYAENEDINGLNSPGLKKDKVGINSKSNNLNRKWSKKNTIMIEDTAFKGFHNQENHLLIKTFTKDIKYTDNELVKLQKYLLLVFEASVNNHNFDVTDFMALNPYK